MSRHKKYSAESDGWTVWVTPKMDGYRMACCDCGLVHDMRFMALRKTKDLPDRSWEARELPTSRYRIQFKVRRNNRATAQMRRKHQVKAE